MSAFAETTPSRTDTERYREEVHIEIMDGVRGIGDDKGVEEAARQSTGGTRGTGWSGSRNGFSSSDEGETREMSDL